MTQFDVRRNPTRRTGRDLPDLPDVIEVPRGSHDRTEIRQRAAHVTSTARRAVRLGFAFATGRR